MNLKFLKITASIVFNQRFEQGTLGSESKCSSTVPSWGAFLSFGHFSIKLRAGMGRKLSAACLCFQEKSCIIL